MQIVLNGSPHIHKEDGNLQTLLKEMGANPERVAVVLNGNIIPRARIPQTQLQNQDNIEVVTFAGGG